MAESATSGNKLVSRSSSQQTTQEAHAYATRAAQTLQPEDQFVAGTQLARSRSRYRRTAQFDSIATQQATSAVTSTGTERSDVAQRRQSRRESQLAPIIQPNLDRKPSARRYRDSCARPLIKPTANADVAEVSKPPISEADSNNVEGRRRQTQERYSVTRESPPDSPAALPLEQTRSLRQESSLPLQTEPVQPSARPVLFDEPPVTQVRATKSTSALPTVRNSNDGHEEEEDAGCFNLFKRRKMEQGSNMKEKTSILRPKKSREPVVPSTGGGGAIPGIDAPISAVNAGDREVLVQCGKSKDTFPITPTTTPVDIFKSASKCMPERIDVQSAVLLEHFVTVGVQRPLRRYEHIRDVMNSWETDKQNSLILIDPGTGSSEAELSLAGVPAEKPDEKSWVLEFSQKVGKWDKRIITLRSDGQITAQKDPNKPQEPTNLCHLSDFDIYRPTQEKMRKKIKPPKRFCFAIKSQQKTAMFESTYDFVHFFCTNDRPTADAFYAAVQAWRSWYLVNVMGEGRKVRQTKESLEKPLMDLRIDDTPNKAHASGDSSGAQPQTTAFKPLLNVTRIEMPAKPTAQTRELQASAPASGFKKSSNQFDTTISPERRTSTVRKQSHPPGSMMNRVQLGEDEPLANLGRKGSVTQRSNSLDGKRSLERSGSTSEEFADTGLLGRNYSQRRQEYEERERERKAKLGSTPGQNLQHSNSRAKPKRMPEPLVDLTPTYPELPQHSKKGRAFIPENVGEGGLIESATSPEDPVGIPAKTDWRAGRNNTNFNQQNLSSALTRNASTARSMRRPDRDKDTGFTGEGLLAGSQAGRGWGESRTGRGVMDGSRAKGPMLDMGVESVFAQGSLIARVESAEGPPMPIIDRSRTED